MQHPHEPVDGSRPAPAADVRMPYAAPRLAVYGSFRDLTLTEVEFNPRNDMFGNFKTI